MPPIPAEVIAEYVELRSRLLSLERAYPNLIDYFRVKVQSMDDDQILMDFHSAVCGDREAEDKVKQAIGRLMRRFSEEDAVMHLAQAYEQCGGDLDRAIEEMG